MNFSDLKSLFPGLMASAIFTILAWVPGRLGDLREA